MLPLTRLALGAGLALMLFGCVTKPASVKSQDEAVTAVEDAGSTTPAAAEGIKVYQVMKGDALWTIAAREEIYGDAWLYPLLFRANSDLISYPDQLQPGLKLIVPRGQSATELEAAREEARAARFLSHRALRDAKAAAGPSPLPSPTALPTATAKPSPMFTPAATPAPQALANATAIAPKTAGKKPTRFWGWILLLLIVIVILVAWRLLRRGRKDS
jgi:nucleoid-associated protein YgaU